MARKSKPVEAQPGLVLAPAAAVVPAAASAPWEYSISGEPWRCWKSAELAAEFGLTAGEVAEFHAVAQAMPRSWLIVRRLYGLVPVVPAPGTEPEDLRPWGAPELAASLGLTRPQMQSELHALRGHWDGRKTPVLAAPAAEAPAAPREELALETPEQVLARQGFPDIQFRTQAEGERFLKRVEDFAPLLREAAASGMARELLIHELRIARLDAQLDAPNAMRENGAEWRLLLKTRTELSERYEGLMKLILDKFPWAQQVAGKVTLKGVMSEITAGILAYKARGDTQLLDGVHTALEIQVLCRMSAQAPQPRYRAGKVVYLNEARAGLHDPSWQSQLTKGFVKRADACWAETYAQLAREAGDPLPDLEKEGPEGEYPKLVEPGKPG